MEWGIEVCNKSEDYTALPCWNGRLNQVGRAEDLKHGSCVSELMLQALSCLPGMPKGSSESCSNDRTR